MDHLWAPWRLAYVTRASGDDSACVFCGTCSDGSVRLDPDAGREDLILVRGRVTHVILIRRYRPAS